MHCCPVSPKHPAAPIARRAACCQTAHAPTISSDDFTGGLAYGLSCCCGCCDAGWDPEGCGLFELQHQTAEQRGKFSDAEDSFLRPCEATIEALDQCVPWWAAQQSRMCLHSASPSKTACGYPGPASCECALLHLKRLQLLQAIYVRNCLRRGDPAVHQDYVSKPTRCLC
jgi:hypothetical protein